MHRLFVALRPPLAIRDHLLGLMGGVHGARWQSDDQMHITLRFIGEVDRRVGEDVATTLSAIVAPPTTIRLDGVGAFDKRGRVDALWAGLAPHDALVALHRKIDRACIAAGLPAEGRAYLPHITLARFARGAFANVDGFLARNAGLASPPFTLDAFGLYESTLGGEGARYACISRFALRG